MSSSTTQVKKAMISSTVRDLPDHRKHVSDACLRQSMFPLMMEHLPANDDEAISASLKMVDEADIYIGVFAQRYGYVPTGHALSVTEMEYKRAVERKIPRLIFIADKKHPFTEDQWESEPENIPKLRLFKEKVGVENIVKFFISPEDLRAHVTDSLSRLPKEEKTEIQFHYVSEIPVPPETYIAHPYTLLQAKGLFGRQPELNLLNNWIAGKGDLANIRIFNVVAVGGMGKSALTWKWFNDIAPRYMKPMAGQMWWSFYESDAYFENFVIRALAYVSRRSIENVKKIPVGDREAELLRILDHEPYLLVLDGLERILIAYARMDAAHLADDDYDKATANRVANAYGMPESAAQSFTGEHRLRKTADPRAGNFLRKLSKVNASRILVSTRLYPFDLQMITGAPGPGCSAIFLRGLHDNDALTFWRSFEVSGTDDQLLPLFHTFENHPLLLQVLAGEISRFRPAPFDFDKWKKANPGFNPFHDLKEAKSHVLRYATKDLSKTEQKALHTIAAFRMPAQYETLQALLVGKGKPCADEKELDALLNELEDRGLIGWDRRANRYDLHPVVRGVVWSGVSEMGKKVAYIALQGYFDAAPKIENWQDVNSLEDLTPAIELYNALIGLGRFDDAYNIFRDKLENAILYRLGSFLQQIEILEKLFPDSLEQPPRLASDTHKALTFNTLSLAYRFSGQPEKGSSFLKKSNALYKKIESIISVGITMFSLSDIHRLVGRMQESAAFASNALEIFREKKSRFNEAESLAILGLAIATAGQMIDSKKFLKLSLQIFIAENHQQREGYSNANLAQYSYWFDIPAKVKTYADRAWELAPILRVERDFIRAACFQGQAALGLNDLDTADERLHHALTRARAINFIEEELPSLIALAELRRRQGKPEEARQLLDDVWEAAERGPYPLFHADACNVLCQLERDAGNIPAAIAAATQAYRLAWCDGPPWAYHYGLENAKKHLKELGAPEPEMEEREE